MEIITINKNPNFANSYFIINDDEVIIIDPACSVSDAKTIIKDKKLVGILLTHCHYDHFVGLKDLVNAFNVKCYLNKKTFIHLNEEEVNCAMYFGVLEKDHFSSTDFVFLSDGKEWTLAGLKIQAIYTPGHTDDSVCYLIGENLFTGDTLFRGSVGRTDLATGSSFSQKESLKRLVNLYHHQEINYTIYPGHEEKTDMVTELNNNYYLQFMSPSK